MATRGDDGSIDDLPWASVFDPAANARALSAIQAEGFRAASRIVDQFVRAVEPNDSASAPRDTRNGTVDGNAATPMADFERLTRAWWSMAGQFLLRSMPTRGVTADGGEVALDLGECETTGALNLETSAPGSATAEVWLHNHGSDDHGDVRLVCSDLLNHDGHVLSADRVVLDPAHLPMPKRSSRGVSITVDVGADVPPGIYRGTVLASGHADLWLPIAVTVRLPAS